MNARTTVYSLQPGPLVVLGAVGSTACGCVLGVLKVGLLASMLVVVIGLLLISSGISGLSRNRYHERKYIAEAAQRVVS